MPLSNKLLKGCQLLIDGGPEGKAINKRMGREFHATLRASLQHQILILNRRGDCGSYPRVSVSLHRRIQVFQCYPVSRPEMIQHSSRAGLEHLDSAQQGTEIHEAWRPFDHI